MNMPVSHSTIAEAGIHCKMDVEYLVRENGVMQVRNKIKCE